MKLRGSSNQIDTYLAVILKNKGSSQEKFDKIIEMNIFWAIL